MGYHPRIECKKIASFQTTRSRRSELWFVNSPALEKKILSFVAKYSTRYRVKLYAFAIEGNHVQFPALFPKANRAHFMRDLNSSIARAVPRYQKTYSGGRLWARRYSAEYVFSKEKLEKQFFYTVLQAVQDGLVDRIEDYPGYNCFEDAITGTVRTFKVVRWKQYHDARRWDKSLPIEKFTDTFELKYERLPGYKHLSQKEYELMMRKKLKEKTQEILRDRNGKKGVGRAKLLKVIPGSLPKTTKTSGPTDHRPRVFAKNKTHQIAAEAWYFTILLRYRKASARYRAGDLSVKFPPGTYRPPSFTIAFKGKGPAG